MSATDQARWWLEPTAIGPILVTDEIGRDDAYVMHCTYRWRHLPSGRTGVRTVAVEGGLSAFHALLARWNELGGTRWKYSTRGTCGAQDARA